VSTGSTVEEREIIRLMLCVRVRLGFRLELLGFRLELEVG
jgi:hypothetical protein